MSSAEQKNTRIWEQVQQTDPQYTKAFSRAGGFRGTGINAAYMAKRATEVYGPIGLGWGVDVVKESYLDGAIIDSESGQRTIIHTLQIELWYIDNGQRGAVTHFGQTPFVYKDSKGIKTDEEAPKKSLTDATNKALSMLGFSADIWLGLWDDAEYVEKATDAALMEKADDKDAEALRQEEKYKVWRAEHIEILKTAVSAGELRTVYNMMERKARSIGDHKLVEALPSIREKRVEEIKQKAAGAKK